MTRAAFLLTLSILAAGAHAQDAAADREAYVRARLDEARMTLEGDAVPFADLVQVLRDVVQVDIVVDPGVDRTGDLRVDLWARDQPARVFLDQLCEFYDLGWSIAHGVVLIEPLSGRLPLETRTWPVEDVLARLLPDPFPASERDEDEPLGALRSLLAATDEGWDQPGRFLLVDAHQVAAVHRHGALERVEDLLTRLRGTLSLEHRIRIATVEGEWAGAEPSLAAPVDAPHGRTVRLGGLAVQTSPGPGSSVRLRVAGDVETEVVVPTGRWVELAGLPGSQGRRTLVARIDPVEGTGPSAEPSPHAALEEQSVGYLEFEKHPLREVVEFFRANFDPILPLVIDSRVLRRPEEELRVTLKVSDLNLRDALRLTVESLGLSLDFAHGVFIVRDPATAPRRLRLHDLRHMAAAARWLPGGGEGGGFLALLALEEEHARIDALASGAAANGARSVRFEVRTAEGDFAVVGTSGVASSVGTPSGDRISIRASLSPAGDAIVRLEDRTGVKLGRVAPGEWWHDPDGGGSVRFVLGE